MEKQYNLNTRRYVTVQEGEHLCPKCRGKGRVPMKHSKIPSMLLECDKCLGVGKLDWVEKATGKRRVIFNGQWTADAEL